MADTSRISGCSNDGQRVVRHLEINRWLEALDLLNYVHCFSSYSGVEEILDFDERRLLALGVTNGAHRAKLMSSLVVLRTKYQKAVASQDVENVADVSEEDVNQLAESDNYICPSQRTVNQMNKKNSLDTSMVLNLCGTTEEKLKAELEAELKLDGSDLRSHAWYHGHISRDKAENMVQQNGQFLVRDCISRPGDFVLTCRWKDKIMHFMINRMLLNENSLYERVLYQFEEEQFISVPDLVRFYVGHKKCVTELSGAILSEPVNRKYPLSVYSLLTIQSKAQKGEKDEVEDASYLTTKYLSRNQMKNSSNKGLDNLVIPPISASLLNRPLPQPPVEKAGVTTAKKAFVTPPGAGINNRNLQMLKNGAHLSKSCSSSLLNASNSVSNISETPKTVSTGNLRSYGLKSYASSGDLIDSDKEVNSGGLPGKNAKQSSLESVKLKKAPSNDTIRTVNSSTSPKSPQKTKTYSPPSKPNRAPSLRSKEGRPTVVIRNKLGRFQEVEANCLKENDDYHEYCDIDYEDIDNDEDDENDIKFTTVMPTEVVDRDSACVLDYSIYDRNDKRLFSGVSSASPIKVDCIHKLQKEISNGIDLNNYRSALMNSEHNKPLDNGLWVTVKKILSTSTPSQIAHHITCKNVSFMSVLGCNQVDDEKSYLDFLTLLLPQSAEFRRSLLDRLKAMEAFVCTTILKGESVLESADLLSVWIQVADKLRNTEKDLLGFNSVMTALEKNAIKSLKSVWTKLRNVHTSDAVLYETTLRLEVKNLERCSCSCHSSTSVEEKHFSNSDNCCSKPLVLLPNLGPILHLLEATEANDTWLYDWEAVNDDFGLEDFWCRLEALRECALRPTNRLLPFPNILLRLGRSCDEIAHLPDEVDVEKEIFQTEFLFRFLWGSKGALIDRGERHAKFDRILDLMSERYKALPVENAAICAT